MLFEIMRHIRNFFATDKSVEGALAIEDGTMSLPFALDGQYVLIEGSALNDGVYKAPLENLTDEKFNGRIVALAVPGEFLELVEEIKAYNEKSKESGIYQSESFGGYSYSKATGRNGGVATWQDAYRSRLNVWRKL